MHALSLQPIAADFEAAIDAFLFSRRIKNCAPLTLAYYRQTLKAFAQFCQQRNETPETFSRQTVLAYLHLRLQRNQPPTVNAHLRAIKAFSRWLAQEGFRSDDPTKGIERLKEPMHYPRTLSDDQVVALVNAIAERAHTFVGLRDLAMVVLMLDTGIRASEAVNLRLSDLDLAQGFVRVFGKGAKERFVPISESVKVVLLRYLLRRREIRNAGDWLFVTSLGVKMTRWTARYRLRYWAQKVGIEGVRISPHSLRFTFVRKWLQSGGDSLVLQRLLGHTTPAMTSHYARLFCGDLKDVHRRFSPVESLAPSLKLPRQRLR